MFAEIDLRSLAEKTAPERAFLSLYISGPEALASVNSKLNNAKALVADFPDEAEHFAENEKLVSAYLDTHKLKKGGLAIFACWALDFFEAYPIEAPIEDVLWVGSAPYIRPLARIQDDYEDFAVVAADNKATRIWLVSSLNAQSEQRIKGNIKNHVRKGGWSQQRYERRRDKDMLHYVKKIAGALADLEKNNHFRRIFMVGSKETLTEIQKALSKRLAKKVFGEKPIDLGKGEKWIEQEIFELFEKRERDSEKELWGLIKNAYMSGQAAALGISEVLEAAKTGRVEAAIATRHKIIDGIRCRNCDHLAVGNGQTCPSCGSTSVFSVEMINEVTKLLAQTGATMDIAEPFDALSKAGDIAALLRY